MAGVIDLGSARRAQQLQQMQLMQQFMVHSPAFSTGESNVDRVLREQAEDDIKQRAADRLEKESEARQAEAVAKQHLAEHTGALKDWEAGQKDIRMYEKGQREERITDATIPKLGAETEAAQAHAGLFKTQAGESAEKTAATRLWEKQQQDKALQDNARQVMQIGEAQAAAGNPQIFKKENADRYENAGKVIFGPNFSIPRDDQGQWTPDLTKLPRATLNEKGVPTGEFAKNLNEADKPKTDFEAIVKAAQHAEATGDTQAAKWYGAKLYEMYSPTIGKVQGQLVKGMLDDGRINDANDQISEWKRAGAPKIQMPDPTARHDTEDMMSTLAATGRLKDQFSELVKAGTIPVGSAMRMKAYDFLNAIEHSNPNVQAFRANLQDTNALYRKFITGKQSNDKEMADLLKAIPNETDDMSAFQKKMAEMVMKTTRKIRINLGVQQAYGIKPPPLGEGLEPITPEEVMKKYGAPDMKSEYSQLVQGALNHSKGVAAIGNQINRSGQQIGGAGEIRDKSPGPSMNSDPSKYPPGMDPSLFSLFDQMSDEDKRAVMTGDSFKRTPGSEGAGARE
jgi:hypothetical protein